MSDKLNPALKRADTGYWSIVWTEKTEKRYLTRSQSTRTKDRAEAEAYFADWKHADKVIAQITASACVADIINAYRDSLIDRDPQGFVASRNCLDIVELYLGHMRVGEFDEKTFPTYKRERTQPRLFKDVTLSSGKIIMHKTKGVSHVSANRELSTLRSAFAYCYDQSSLRAKFGLTADTLPVFSIPPAVEARQHFLKLHEEAEFYALALAHSAKHARLTRVTRFVAIALDTAARTDAIQKLTWDRVDFVSGKINFREAGKRKTKKRRGFVAISKRLRPILERAYAERISEYVLDDPRKVANVYKAWVNKTPYKTTTQHDLRRTWATLAVQAGVPIPKVAEVLSDTVAIVLKHYAVHVPDNTQDAVDFREKRTLRLAAE
jgi:integrase